MNRFDEFDGFQEIDRQISVENYQTKSLDDGPSASASFTTSPIPVQEDLTRFSIMQIFKEFSNRLPPGEVPDLETSLLLDGMLNGGLLDTILNQQIRY